MIFSWELQTEPSALTETHSATPGPILTIFGFWGFFALQKKWSEICKPHLQSYTEWHFLGVFHLRSENFCHLCFADDQNCSEVSEKSKQLSSEFLAYLTLPPKPRQHCCHFYHGICVHIWKKPWKYMYHN